MPDWSRYHDYLEFSQEFQTLYGGSASAFAQVQMMVDEAVTTRKANEFLASSIYSNPFYAQATMIMLELLRQAGEGQMDIGEGIYIRTDGTVVVAATGASGYFEQHSWSMQDQIFRAFERYLVSLLPPPPRYLGMAMQGIAVHLFSDQGRLKYQDGPASFFMDYVFHIHARHESKALGAYYHALKEGFITLTGSASTPVEDEGMWNATCKCGAKAYVGFARVECQAHCEHPGER